MCVCVRTHVCTRAHAKLLGHVWLFVTPWTPWTVASWAPLSMGFRRQEHWSGLPFPPPEDLPDPKLNPNLVSCTGRQILYHQHHLGTPMHSSNYIRTFWACCCMQFNLNENNLKIVGKEALGELWVRSGHERMIWNERWFSDRDHMCSRRSFVQMLGSFRRSSIAVS